MVGTMTLCWVWLVAGMRGYEINTQVWRETSSESLILRLGKKARDNIKTNLTQTGYTHKQIISSNSE